MTHTGTVGLLMGTPNDPSPGALRREGRHRPVLLLQSKKTNDGPRPNYKHNAIYVHHRAFVKFREPLRRK